MEQPATLSTPEAIGTAAFNMLTDINVPPKPAYYQVLFSHFSKSNHALSSELDEKLRVGDGLDEYFLRAVHEKYFKIANPTKDVSSYASELLAESVSLHDLSKEFSSNAEEFTVNLETASSGARAYAASDASTAEVLSSLVDAVKEAASRNRDLEESLKLATNKIADLRESIEEVAKDANTDFLTKLNNRRYFDGAIATIFESAEEQNTPLSLIVADIDHFKRFNDTWGHAVGDQVLKLVAEVLRENVKGQDIVARYGGEEFAIALPNTSETDASTLAEQIRAAIAKRKLINRASNENLGRITMSFGVAARVGRASAQELYDAADAALYRAKETGRNKVVRSADAGE